MSEELVRTCDGCKEKVKPHVFDRHLRLAVVETRDPASPDRTNPEEALHFCDESCLAKWAVQAVADKAEMEKEKNREEQ